VLDRQGLLQMAIVWGSGKAPFEEGDKYELNAHPFFSELTRWQLIVSWLFFVLHRSVV